MQDYVQWAIADGIKNGFVLLETLLNSCVQKDCRSIKWAATIKNEAIDQKLLKGYAKKHDLVISLQKVTNEKQEYWLVNVLGFGNTHSKTQDIPVQQLLSLFEAPKFPMPMLVKLEKEYMFNRYGMHERVEEQQCELCMTVNDSKFNLLNCCGKSVCDPCEKYYSETKICPFCKQEIINLRLHLLKKQWFKH